MNAPSALGRLAWVALPALLLLGPRTYACELHPLARLSQKVEKGMPIQQVLSRFEAYASRSGPGAGGNAVFGDLEPTGSGGEAATRVVFIQDLWLEEDLKLTAWFDREGALQGTRFRCGN